MHILVEMFRELNAILKADIKRGKKWFYSNHGCKTTMESARKNNALKSNCARTICWALVRAGLLDSKYAFYGDKGIIKWSEACKKAMLENFEIVNGKGVTQEELVKNGTIKMGDIVMYKNLTHTNMYAGGGWWYDAGGAYSGAYGENVPFKTWHGKSHYDKEPVSFILRLKTNGNYKKTAYRVQIAEEYKTKATATKMLNKLIKLDVDGPYITSPKDIYRVTVQVFKTKNKAQAFADEMSTKHGLKCKVRKISFV